MLAIAAALAAGALVVAPAAAARCPKTSLADVEDEVMCPVCGTPLSLNTEAPQAVRQRDFIVRLVERCRSKDEVKAALAAEFGDGVLAVPEDEGFDLAAYLVPAIALAAAAALLVFATTRWRRSLLAGARRPELGERGALRSPGERAAEAADETRLEADMRRYDL